MKKFAITLAAVSAVALSSSAFAADGDFEKLDADKDGQLTMEQGKVMHTDWTDDAFKSVDTDKNGSLSKEEYEAATKS